MNFDEMKIFAFYFVAALLIGLLIIMLTKIMNKKLITVFSLDNCPKQFEILSKGYYSIAILGAGFIREKEKVDIKLVLNENQIIDVNANKFAFRFIKDKKTAIEYWNFVTSDAGSCELAFINVENIEAKKSMLKSKRLFQSPIDHGKLKGLVYKTINPIYRLISIVIFVIVTSLILFGVTLLIFPS